MIKLTAFAVATLMTLGVAHADDHSEGGKAEKGAKYAKMDTNGDGFITKDEMLKMHEKRVNEHFSKMDTNNDGKLSKEEMRAGKKAMRKNMKERMGKMKERKASREQKRTAE